VGKYLLVPTFKVYTKKRSVPKDHEAPVMVAAEEAMAELVVAGAAMTTLAAAEPLGARMAALLLVLLSQKATGVLLPVVEEVMVLVLQTGRSTTEVAGKL